MIVCRSFCDAFSTLALLAV